MLPSHTADHAPFTSLIALTTHCRLDAGGESPYGRTPALQLTNVTIMLNPVELQVNYWIHISIDP